jgi:hypothetical protein
MVAPPQYYVKQKFSPLQCGIFGVADFSNQFLTVSSKRLQLNGSCKFGITQKYAEVIASNQGEDQMKISCWDDKGEQ